MITPEAAFRKLDENRQVVRCTPQEAGEWLVDIERRRVGYDEIGPLLISTCFTPLPSFTDFDVSEANMRYFETLIRGRWLAPELREMLGATFHHTWAEAEGFHTKLVGYLERGLPSADPDPRMRQLVAFLLEYIDIKPH